MISYTELFNELSKSDTVFALNNGINYKSIFQISYNDHPKMGSKWLVIYDNSSPSALMALILRCIHLKQNIVITSVDNNSHPELEKLPNCETKEVETQLWNNNQKSIGSNFFHFNDIKIGILTSGSSGESKIIIHPISNILTNALAVNENLKSSENTLFQIALPTYHIAGLSILFRALLLNASINQIEQFHLETEKISGVISLVPTQLIKLLKNPNIKPQNLTLYIGGGK